jgi:serine/threonine protein kinase
MAYASASFLRSDLQESDTPGSHSLTSEMLLLNPDSSLDFLFTPSPPPLLNISSSIRELNHHEIELDRVIGEGSFGTVVKARWRDMNIAIKYFKQFQQPPVPRSLQLGRHGVSPCPGHGSSEEEIDGYLEEFSREVETMARVCNHMFVIQLVGIVRTPHLSVVTMFYENGSLEDLLVLKTKTLSQSSLEIETSTLVRFALETAIGIRHLHLEGIIHRDLAARNLLVDDNLHIRVSDFGFSRMKEAGTTRGYTQSSLGPIRWSAPEAMRKKKYSEASDVFSLGVVLFEIFAQEMPWKGIDTVDVVIAVCGGERMSLPCQDTVTKIPPAIAALMTDCWAHDPDARPLLPSIIATLRSLKDSSFPPLHFASPSSASNAPQPQRAETASSRVISPPPSPVNVNVLATPSSRSHLSSLSSFSSLLSLQREPSRGGVPVHRDLSLEIVTEPFQQTWEEYHDSVSETRASPAPLPPTKLQRDSSASGASLSDEEFLLLAEQDRLHAWGHEATLRVMYLMLQQNHRSSETVDRIVERFRIIQKKDFHLTIVYFWIQVPPLFSPHCLLLTCSSLTARDVSYRAMQATDFRCVRH